MILFDTLLTGEIARRRRIGEERKKALADPTKMQDLLAKGMKSQVPEGRKIKTKKYPTKLAATEAAIPEEDPRSKLGTATWSRYTGMMEDPRFKKFSPRDLLVASSELELDKRREDIHRYIQKQKVGTFSTFLKEEYAPMPGQEEWEAEHPPRIPHMRAEISALWGAGTKAAIEAGKFAFGKGPAAKMGRRKAIALMAKAGPYGKLAAAGAGAIVGMRAFEEVASRTTEQVKKTEYGKEHPLAAELIGMGTGLAVGVAVPVEAMFGSEGRFVKKTYKALKKFATDRKFRDQVGAAVMKNPAAEEIIKFKKAEEAVAKSGDKAVATIDKDKVATMKRLVDTLEGRVVEEKAAAMPMPGGTALAVREEAALASLERVAGIPVPRAMAMPGPVSPPSARVAGVPSKLKIPEKAIVIEQETPNLPMLKPDGSLSSLGSRKVVPYGYGNIKSEEGFDRVLSEVAGGKKKAVDAVQLVGEMDEGVIRHSKVIPAKKVTVVFKKKMSDLGYDAEEIAGMNEKVASNITRFSGKKKEPSMLLDKALREPISKKIESKIDLSDITGLQKLAKEKGVSLGSGMDLMYDKLGKPTNQWVGPIYTIFKKDPKTGIDRELLGTSSLEKVRSFLGGIKVASTEEKLYGWAKTLPPQKRLDLVERGTISEAVNRRIVKEQKALIEGKPEYKEFVAKEAEADTVFLGVGTGSIPKDDGSYKAMTKAEFVLKMMSDQAKKAAGKSLAVTAASASTFGALSMPDTAEAGVMDSMVKVFKAATRTEGKAAASRLNLEYNGVQEGLDGPLCHLFTDPKRGATFAAQSIDEVDVKAALETSERIWEEAYASRNTAIGATVFAALTTTLGNIFSPAEAEAAGIVDLGRTLTGLTATVAKDVKPGKVKGLVKEMKGSGLIAESQVDHCYVLKEPRKSLVLIPNVKDVVKKASMPPGAEAVVSPHVQFLYYTGVREGQELMNNAGVQWASCQGTAVWNSMQGHKTLMNILEDFIPGYNSSAKGAIKAMAPVVEKFHVPMQERAFHLGMARDLKRSYEKEFSKLTKRRKFKKGEADEGLVTVTRLETLYKEHDAAYKASEAMKDEYQAAWHTAMKPFASKAENSGTRIFLAAEDTANFKHYPWLKDIITWEEKAAAAKLKDMMEHYSVRAIEAGEKVITTRPFMHHAWHPAMKSELARLNKGATLMSPPMTKLHSRSAGYMPMVPDAEYSVTSYLQDINIRLEAMEFWKKGEKDGWWAYKKWLTENPSQAPEGLIKAFNQFEKGFKPVDTSGGFNKFSEKVYAFEVARLLAFSASVPFKHSLKLIADLRVFGMEGVKAAPKAASSIVKIAIKQRGGEEWLKKKGWGLDVVDEAVEAYTETGKLYRVVSDISPFRVNESMADKAIGKFNEIGGTPTSIVERFDRALSTVAGIRMAAKRGMTPAQSTYAIYDTILKSNFLSGQLNPSWLRNPAIRLMMIFQGTPFKIMEQRIALHGRAWKGVGETLGQLRRDVIKGEQEFKWEMIKQGFGKQKDIFGNTLLSQSIREMVLVGTGVTAAKYVWDGDLSHHFFHPPFFKAQRRDIAIGASPLVNASLETYSKYMDEDYDDFVVSTFFNSWFDSTYKGLPAPIPVNFKKATRLSENDIPERYRDSKLRYLFGVPAWDHD